jgi:hypothetical protein
MTQKETEEIYTAAIRQSFNLAYYELNPSFRRSEWRDYTCKAIQEFLTSNKKYLFVNVPTQHGKSEIVSTTLPAWILGNSPKTRIIIGSNASGIAQVNCAKCYNMMQSPLYKATFQTRTPTAARTGIKEQNKQNFFRVANNTGYYYAVGLDGQITGMSADLIILDDAYGTPSDLDSQAVRSRTESNCDAAVFTRMTENTKVIVVNSRMGSNDIQGYILKKLLMAGANIHDLCEFVIFPIYKTVEPIQETIIFDEKIEIIETGAKSHTADSREIGEILDKRQADPINVEIAKKSVPHVFNCLYAQNPSLSLGGGVDWFSAFDDERQSRIIKPEIKPVTHLPYYLVFDFNVKPYTCLVAQCSPYNKANAKNPNHFARIIDVIQISEDEGGVKSICKTILEKYKGRYFVSGDSNGYNSMPTTKIGQRECKNNFQVINASLPNSEILAPKAKLSYEKSNTLCNTFIMKFAGLEISQATCMVLINDLLTARVKQGTKFELLKDRLKNKQDAGDCFRYFVDTFYNI